MFSNKVKFCNLIGIIDGLFVLIMWPRIRPDKIKDMENRKLHNRPVTVYLIVALIVVAAMGLGYMWLDRSDAGVAENRDMRIKAPDGFWVTRIDTPNVSEGKNAVEGIVLHHTATESLEKSLKILTDSASGVSCHVLIDTDGSRYVLASPEAITWHAGRSRLNGKEGCNNFTVGIEFQGNTVEQPLTDRQIESAIDYVLPIMEEYEIPMSNIVTHEQIRDNYKKAHPKRKTPPKVDVTPDEYARFMTALDNKLHATDRG